MFGLLRSKYFLPATAGGGGGDFPLALPLLSLSPKDRWHLRDACEGTLILGGTGSGKTSGSGQALAHAFLRAGFGGLVLCAKPGEAELWCQYAAACGRLGHVMLFDREATQRFNFLEYEMRRSDHPDIHSLVSVFLCIMEASSGGRSGPQSAEDSFWRGNVSELLSNALEALYGAWGRVRLDDLMRFLDSTAQTPQEAKDERWQQASFCYATLERLFRCPAMPVAGADRDVITAYFFKRWPRVHEKTRTGIIATLTGMMHPFLKGYLRELFCTSTNIVPEMTHYGALIICDLPVKTHGESGILAQHIWKYLWQRATERRAVTPATRPAFLWADECQFFLSEYDGEFQSTARSSLGLTVYLTQTLEQIYAKIGGRQPERTANALLANFQTKIFHNNNCATTNQWAAEMIGRVWQWVATHGGSDGFSESEGGSFGKGSNWGSSSSDTMHGSHSSGGSYTRGKNWGSSRHQGRSNSLSQQVQHEVLPAIFTRLLKGGPPHGKTEAIIVQSGRVFRHGNRVWLKAAFLQ